MGKTSNRILKTAVFAGFTVLAVHTINNIISGNALLKNKLGTARERYYDWKFGRIFYTKKGKGTPLLLIHDVLPGSAGYEWKKIEEKLEKEHTVYTVDLLGCGRSDKPDITYTGFLYVQLLTDFVRDVIQEPTDVISSRFSSTFVCMTCLNDKNTFKKVILVNPPKVDQAQKMPTEKNRILREILRLPIFGTLVYNMMVSKENVMNLFTNQLFYNPFQVTQDLVDTYYEAAHKKASLAKNLYSCFVSNYLSVNLTHALESIVTEIMIVTGEEQESQTLGNEYQKIKPEIQLHSIERAGQLPQLESPEAFLTVVTDFLD